MYRSRGINKFVAVIVIGFLVHFFMPANTRVNFNLTKDMGYGIVVALLVGAAVTPSRW